MDIRLLVFFAVTSLYITVYNRINAVLFGQGYFVVDLSQHIFFIWYHRYLSFTQVDHSDDRIRSKLSWFRHSFYRLRSVPSNPIKFLSPDFGWKLNENFRPLSDRFRLQGNRRNRNRTGRNRSSTNEHIMNSGSPRIVDQSRLSPPLALPLVKQLRAAKPLIPIILVEDRRFTNDWITPEKFKFHTENHAALKAAFEQLIGEGVKYLYYIPGDKLYGDDTEGATDASHANDLGFMRQADVFAPVLRDALNVFHENASRKSDR